jgi:hypothetical protein
VASVLGLTRPAVSSAREDMLGADLHHRSLFGKKSDLSKKTNEDEFF